MNRPAYALFMMLALITFLVVRWLMPKSPSMAKLPWQIQWALAFSAFLGGILGAKLPFIIMNQDDPTNFWAWASDGKTITTGLFGAYLGVELGKLLWGITAKTGDSYALPLACAMTVGRLGCFFNGCCYGTVCKLGWAVNFGDGVPRHPIQIYESLFHASMAFILLSFMKQGWLQRHRLKFYLIGYAIFRFLTEYLRPEPILWQGLTFYQIVAFTGAMALMVQWWFDARVSTAVSEDQNSPTFSRV